MLKHVDLDEAIGKTIRKTYLSSDRVVLVFDDCYANVEFAEGSSRNCPLWLWWSEGWWSEEEIQIALHLGIVTAEKAASHKARRAAEQEKRDRAEYERLRAKFEK